MGDDAALRRCVVVRRDDEEAVGAELVRFFGEVHGVRGRVGACARDHGRLVADCFERSAEEIEPLRVGQGGALAGGAGNDDAVGAIRDEVAGKVLERVEVDRAVVAKRRDDRCQHVAEH